MDYSAYKFLRIEKPAEGVVLLVMNRPDVLNACDAEGHAELGRIWLDIDRDPEAKVAVITGAGSAFCSGGNLKNSKIGDPATVIETMRSDAAIVKNIVNSKKPIISAINGVAVGAGLAVALLADISVASEKARIIDGHTKLGVVAGDHAALLWPLLIGLARTKYYLLLCEQISGREAADMGLVSLCVPSEEVLSTSLKIADRLAAGSQWAIKGTKQVLNNWLSANQSIFDNSLNLEMASFFMPDAFEGVAAFKEKRTPSFPSALGRQD